jgi:YidC/Oxa1 family membrane protein insertase
MVVSMVWQQKLTPSPSTSPEQAKIMTFMPIIFGFIFYNLPSGLVLYWTVNNFLTIFHQLFIKKYLPHPHIAD